MSSLEKLKKDLARFVSKKRAEISSRYFKTIKGEYGEGDTFLGISVPAQRDVARNFPDLSFENIEKLLKTTIHEYRFVALEILIAKYEIATNEAEKKKIVDFYLAHTIRINNWDLVDTSASYILGNFLFDKDRKILYKLVRSKSIWERRIAIIATHYFINKKEHKDTCAIVKLLLKDKEDLIHKACGWMLREVGKKDKKVLVDFLKENYKVMPRTCLRYSIEKFSKEERQRYLKGLV